MPEDYEALIDALFEVFSAGFEAGYTKEIDIHTAFNEWLSKAILPYLPPNSPYVS